MCPTQYHPDNGSNFTADEVESWCANLGIKLDYASVYHPQTNGQVKRANGLIMSGIKPILVRSWKESDKHGSTSSTPYSGGCGPRPIALPNIHLSSWCTMQRLCYPATLFMTHLECACMKRERPNLIEGQLRCPGGGARCREGPFRILSIAGSKVSKQRSTSQNL